MIAGTAYAAQVKEGVLTNDAFDAKNTFETSETVYAKYYNDLLCSKLILKAVGNKSVDIYILKDAVFSDGAKIDDSKIIKTIPSTLAEVCDKKMVWEPALSTGKYDVLVDVSNCGIVKKISPRFKCEELNIEKHYNPALGDAYDSINNVGFEVLPEMVTSVLLVAGLASMMVYTSVSKN